MKKVVFSILLVWISAATMADWNLNGDCIVNFADFALFAADWQDPYDVNDLADFAAEWLEYKTLDRSPVAADQQTSVFNKTTKTITLTATDANGDDIEFTLLSLPTAEQGVITGIGSVPYTLAGNTFEFDPNDSYTGTVVIQFQADDQTGLTPPCGGIDTAAVTITVTDSPTNPTANAVNADAVAYVGSSITLDANDDSFPNPPAKLRYIITSLPTHGTLQDPSNGNAVIDSVPYTLGNWSNVVRFISDTTGADNFQYKAFDGGYPPLDGYSNIATVSVTVYANLTDSLAFDGYGYVSFADHVKYDVVDGWAVDFYVKVDKGATAVGLAQKWDGTPTGKGYEIGIVFGKPKFYLHDGAGGVESFRYPFRIDDGAWHEVSIIFYENGGLYKVQIEVDSEPHIIGTASLTEYSNSEPLIVGLHTRDGYKYEFDKLRFFSGCDPETYYMAFIQGLIGRTEASPEVVLGFGKASDVLFMCDEGTGSTITDSKLSLTGSFNSGSHVLWTPPIQVFTDTAVQQYQLLNGGNE